MNMNAQELIETLEWRYATKVFNPDRRIPAEDWEAPSGIPAFEPFLPGASDVEVP